MQTTDQLEGCVVLYGGSFDPPHMGHQMACMYLLEGLGAEAVWLVPVGRHAFGKALSPGPARLALAQKMAAPFAGRVVVEPIEVLDDQISRTYQTLIRLRRAHPGTRFVLAIGSDVLPTLHAWDHAEELLAQTPVVVLGRQSPGASSDETTVCPQSPRLFDVSSTTVRRRLAAGESVRGLVPHSVAQAIAEMGLYRQTSGA